MKRESGIKRVQETLDGLKVKDGIVTFDGLDDKFTLISMSIDQMDECEDMIVVNQADGTTIGLARATTAWLRRGIKDMTDERIRRLSSLQKLMLEAEVRKFNTMGETKPSHSD